MVGKTMTIQTDALSQEELERYKRQIVLSELGHAGQTRLKQAKILCIGAGGLGSPALLYLAAAGVGTLGIVDMDNVDITNLQRQVLFSENEVNTKKVHAAANRLSALNKHVNINVYDEEFNVGNAETIMRDYDLVIDGTDNFNTKYLINDCAIKYDVPYIYGSILGFEGRVMVVNGQQGPCYRCIFPSPPEGYIPNCAEFGVVGALPGIIGSIQAMEAIKFIVNSNDLQPKFQSLCGKLWMINCQTMRTEWFEIKKRSDCPACARPQTIELKELNPLCATKKYVPITSMTSDEAQQYINNSEVIILDVREAHEWQAGHICNANHLALSQLTSNTSVIKELNPDKTYLVYCQGGKRSEIAATYLRDNGIKNVINLLGGIASWTGKIVND